MIEVARPDRMVAEFMLHGCVLSKVVSSMNAWVIHPQGNTSPRLRYGKSGVSGDSTRKRWYMRIDQAGNRADQSLVSMDWAQIPQTLLIAIPPDTLKAFFEAL